MFVNMNYGFNKKFVGNIFWIFKERVPTGFLIARDWKKPLLV